MVPALGPSIVKPARGRNDGVYFSASPFDRLDIQFTTPWSILAGCLPRSPLFARRSLGIENVFRVSALCVFAMFFATLIFYREPTRAVEIKGSLSGRGAAKHGRRFLQSALPRLSADFLGLLDHLLAAVHRPASFLRGYVDPNAKIDLLLSVDPATVIAFNIVVSYLTRRIPAFKAMTLGF